MAGAPEKQLSYCALKKTFVFKVFIGEAIIPDWCDRNVRKKGLHLVPKFVYIIYLLKRSSFNSAETCCIWIRGVMLRIRMRLVVDE